MTTKVIFRKFRDGEVIALFPEIACSNNLFECMSYMHTGQHGAASVFVSGYTVRASAKESENLREELKRQGYVLKEVKRFHPSDWQKRREQIASK